MTRSRCGFTLMELLVSLTIILWLGALVVKASLQSIHSLRTAALLVEQRAQLSGARAVIGALVAEVSPREADLVRAADSAVVFRATIATGVVCTAGTRVGVPPAVLASGLTLVSHTTLPDVGDILTRWDDGPTRSPVDDYWAYHVITGVTSSGHLCSATGLVDPVADAGATALAFNVTPPVPASAVGFVGRGRAVVHDVGKKQ